MSFGSGRRHRSSRLFIPGLRSLFDPINGIACFGRVLDKIQLAAAF